MSHEVTNTQPLVNRAQSQPLGLAEQVALVQLYLRRVYGVELTPVTFPDAVVLVKENGDEIAEISADGEVYLCDSGESFCIDDVEAALAEEECDGPTDEEYAEYLESVSGKVPVVDVDGQAQTKNSAKKYSESSESYTQPLVSDSIVDNSESAPVETVKIDDADDGATGSLAGADDSASDVESAGSGQPSEQAPATTAPEGVIGNPGPAPQPESIEIPVIDMASAVSEAISTEQVNVAAKAVAPAQSDGSESVDSGIDTSKTLLEGGAKAACLEEEDHVVSQSDQISLSMADPLAEPEVAAEVQREFDDVEFGKAAIVERFTDDDAFDGKKVGVEYDSVASVGGENNSKSKNPLSAGGMAMCDPAGTLATAKEYSRWGAPPHFFAVDFAQDSGAVSKDAHHDVVLPTHGRDGHNDRQDRNGEDEGQGGYFMEDDEPEEKNSVTSIA
jgi:hypothetical protein